MSTETILVLGGSFAGLGAAHYALKHILPALTVKDGTTYTVTMVNPSKDFWWRVGGTRAIVSKQLMPDNKMYYPIEPAFAYAQGKFTFIQGKATRVDAASQTVTVATAAGEEKEIRYVSLVIATGMSTPCPLFTQDEDSKALQMRHDAFRQTLGNAKSIVIGGAGPVGVESAGEIAEFLNGKPGLFASETKNPKVKVTLISAEKQVLPVLREACGKDAAKFLKRLGVDIIYDTKVISATTVSGAEPTDPSAKTTVQLSDGKSLEADIYIDATGIRPNTSFLPSSWLDSRNRVDCNPQTLRVEKAEGPRVYVVGDAGAYGHGGALDQQNAIPVAMTNLRTDLQAHILGSPPGPERHYKPSTAVSQICPIGTQKGVGEFNGNKVPSLMVWALKGRDYMAGQLVPLYLEGNAYKKEGKWTPVKVAAETVNV